MAGGRCNGRAGGRCPNRLQPARGICVSLSAFSFFIVSVKKNRSNRSTKSTGISKIKLRSFFGTQTECSCCKLAKCRVDPCTEVPVYAAESFFHICILFTPVASTSTEHWRTADLATMSRDRETERERERERGCA